MEIASIIRQARKRQGLTQTLLAAQAGVSLPSIQNLERSKANPSVELLNKLSKPLCLEIRLESKEPNWLLLQQAGLPLAIESQKAGKRIRLRDVNPLWLGVEIMKAVRFVHRSKDWRMIECMVALVKAIERFFPTYYAYCVDRADVKTFLSWADRKIDAGRSIKLQRIALARLSKIL